MKINKKVFESLRTENLIPDSYYPHPSNDDQIIRTNGTFNLIRVFKFPVLDEESNRWSLNSLYVYEDRLVFEYYQPGQYNPSIRVVNNETDLQAFFTFVELSIRDANNHAVISPTEFYKLPGETVFSSIKYTISEIKALVISSLE